MFTFDEERVSRRDLFRLSLSAAAFTAVGGSVLGLAGCGGGGGGDEDPPETRIVSGTVDRSDLGADELRIFSARSETQPVVGASGEFAVEASTGGAQLLIATGPDGRLRGYGLSMPGESPRLDAASTAVAMLMLTPGLASSDPAEARSVIARIQSQPRFGELVAGIRARMAAGSLPDYASDDALGELREEIALGAFDADRLRGHFPLNPDINFSVKWGDQSPVNARKMDMTHGGFRFVRVDLQKRDAAGAALSTEVAKDAAGKELTAISGASFASLGSLLSFSAGSPSTTTASVDLTQPAGFGRVKAYVSGLGVAAGSEEPPRRLGLAEMRDAYGRTVVLIFLFPIIDIITGGLGVLRKGGQLLSRAGDVWTAIGNGISLQGLHDAWEAGGVQGIISAVLDTVVAMLGAASAIAIALGLQGAAALAVVTASIAITVLVLIPLSARNMVVAARYLNRTPRVQSVELQVADANVVVR